MILIYQAGLEDNQSSHFFVFNSSQIFFHLEKEKKQWLV